MVRFDADGTWTGFDGCNREGGSYSLASSRVTMTGGPSTDMGCANFSPEEQLDGNVLELDASGDHLTVTDVDGDLIVEYAR